MGSIAVHRARGGRRGAWTALGWLAVAMVALIVFIPLAVQAHQQAYEPFDPPISTEVQTLRSPSLDQVMEAVSLFGYEPWGAIAFAVAVGLLTLARRFLEAICLLLTLVWDGAGQVVKGLVAEPRPTADLVAIVQHAGGSGFPSAHAVHYVLFFGFLLVVTLRLVRPGAARRLLALLLVCLILVGGLSRIYLGDHWASQVLGGYLFGLAGLSLIVALCRWLACRPGRPAAAAAPP